MSSNESLTRRQMLAGSATALAGIAAASATGKAQETPARATEAPAKDTDNPAPEGKVSGAELRAWVQEMCDGINEGRPLNRCIADAKLKARGPYFREVLQGFNQIVAIGYPISRAMAMHPEVFSEQLIVTARYGEIYGILDETLRRYLDETARFPA